MNLPDGAPDPCPCGSGAAYPGCCGRFIGGAALPQTAEQLMRSRYSAYTRGAAEYLRTTWHPNTRPADVRVDTGTRWLGLEIIATAAGGPGDSLGVIEFIARYKVRGRAHRLHERSRFTRHQGAWVYVDGEIAPLRGAGADPKWSSGP
ncbi:MAG TPA: YchJ family metal-binding protein [Lamprocystis sp. (in: g-proteobacteria)]|nr:YchJ family metal-binding protein [Lamprocystis sp. (in: g-proteobacteria)]